MFHHHQQPPSTPRHRPQFIEDHPHLRDPQLDLLPEWDPPLPPPPPPHQDDRPVLVRSAPIDLEHHHHHHHRDTDDRHLDLQQFDHEELVHVRQHSRERFDEEFVHVRQNSRERFDEELVHVRPHSRERFDEELVHVRPHSRERFDEELFFADNHYPGNTSRHRRQTPIDSDTNYSADFASRPTRYDDRRKVTSLPHQPSVSRVKMECEEKVWVRDDRIRKFPGRWPRAEGPSHDCLPSPHKKRKSALLRVQLGKINSSKWNSEEYNDDPDDPSFRGPIPFSHHTRGDDGESSSMGRSSVFPRQRQGENREHNDVIRHRVFSDRRQGEVREFNDIGRQVFSDRRQGEDREFNDTGRPQVFSDRRQGEDREFNDRGRPRVFSDRRQGEDSEFNDTGRPRIFSDRQQGEGREFTDTERPRGLSDLRQGEDREFDDIGRPRGFSDRRQGEDKEFGVGRPRVSLDRREGEGIEFSGRGRPRTFSNQRQEEDRVFSGVRRPIFLSDQLQEEVKEATSVELDVSFKSNTRVTKPLVSSSNQIVSSEGTPNGKKRKGLVPFLSVSSPRVTEICEGPLNDSKKVLVTTSSCNKVLTPSKAKALVSGTSSGVAVESQPCPNVTEVTLAETSTGVVVGSPPCLSTTILNVPPKTSSVLESPSNVAIDSNKKRTTKIIKKKKIIRRKVIVPVSGSPSAPATKSKGGVLNDNTLKNGFGSTISSVKNSTKLDEQLQTTCTETLGDICPQPCQNLVITSGGVCAPMVMTLNGSTPPSDLSRTTDGVNAESGADGSVRQSEGRGTISGRGMKDALQSLDGGNMCRNTAAEKSRSNLVVPSAKTPKSLKKKTVHDRLSGFLGSKAIRERSTTDRSANSAVSAVTFDKGVSQSKENVSASASGMEEDGGLQSSGGLTVSHGNSAAVESLPSPTDRSPGTPMVKKKTVHDRLSGFPSSSRDGAGSILSSDKDLRQSEQEMPTSCSGTQDVVALQALNGITTSYKNSAAVDSHSRPVVSSAEALIVTKKKRVMDRLSGFQTSTHERPVTAGTFAHCVDSALISDKGLRESDQKDETSDPQTTDNVGSQSLDGITVSLEQSVSVQSPIVGSAGMPKKKKTKVMDPLPGLSSSTFREKPVNAESVKGLGKSEKKDEVCSVGVTHAVSLQPVNRSYEKNSMVESFQIPEVRLTNTPEFKKKKSTDHLFGLSVRETEICEWSADAESFDKDHKQSEVGGTISVYQTLEKHSELGSRSSSVLGSCNMDKTSRIQVKDPISGLSCSRPDEIHERIVSLDRSTPGSDAPFISDKDLIQPDLIVTSSFFEENAVTQSLPEYSDAMYGKLKKQQTFETISGFPSTQGIEISVEPSEGNTFGHNNDPVTSSEKGRMKSEEKPIVCGVWTPDDFSSRPLHGVPTSVHDTIEERSSPMHPTVGCFPLVEEPSFQDFPSKYLLRLEGDRTRYGNSILTVNEFPGYASSDVITEIGTGEEKQGKTDTDSAKEHSMLERKNWQDGALHSQMQEESDNAFPLAFHNSLLNEELLGKVTEDNMSRILVKDELPSVSNLRSAVAESSLTPITDYYEKSMDAVPERHITLDSQQSSSQVPELHIMNSEQLQHRSPSQNDCRDSGSNSVNLGKPMHDPVIPAKKLSLASGQSGQPTPMKAKIGAAIGRRDSLGPPVPKAIPCRVSLASGKATDSSTHNGRRRIWRRTDTPSPLPQQEFCSSTGSSQRQSPKKVGKIQSMSYVRKGNSLVRKCAPTVTPPQGSGSLSISSHQLNTMGRDEAKGSAECAERQNGLGMGFVSSRTSTLPCNTKTSNAASKPSQATVPSALPNSLLEGGLESTSDFICGKSPEHTEPSENPDCIGEKPDSPSVFDNEKLKSSKIMGITYVKNKSNQLVASCSSGHDRSVSLTGNMPASHACSPNDQYYKKKKNQLIRTSPLLGSHSKQVATDDSSNSESHKPPKVSSMNYNRNLSKRKVHKVLVRTHKQLKFPMVWTLHGTQNSNEDISPLQPRKIFPHLFPWKRMGHWRNFMSNLMPASKRSTFSLVSKKLLLSRKRDTVYTRSTGGFSLRKSKVLSIGGTNLKWSKSIENQSKRANEEATLAVVAAERRKREDKSSARAAASTKSKSRSSRERIFRIGSLRYKMDPSKRTLQRIPDEKSPCAVDVQPGKDLKRSFIPKRLVIGNDEYVRIGNGNQLVRDPKKLVRILASEKVRWSLHTARLRMARKQQYCQFFTRFGKCNKSSGKCPYIHDPDKVAVCTKFLKGLCSNTDCKLTHKVIPERMEDCSYFLQGLCTNEECPYRHVNVNPNAPVCEGFLRGFCACGNECRKKHTYVCPKFESTGECPQGSMCKLHHPKNQNRTRKRKRSKDPNNGKGRYFGSKSKLIDGCENVIVASDTHTDTKNEDDMVHEEGLSDYINLDASDMEIDDTNDQMDISPKFSDGLDELIKPLRLMNKASS